MIQCSAIKLVRTENGPEPAAIFQETLARINLFDARECPHTLGRTWGAMRVLADQWCFTIRNNNAHPLVLNNSVLRTKHGSRSSEHIESAISVLIPYVIGKFAYGTDRPYVSCQTLASWGDDPANRQVHHYFVRPLMSKWFAVVQGFGGMDTLQAFMEQDLKRSEDRLATKVKRFGYWSKEKMLLKVATPSRNANGTPNQSRNVLDWRNIHDTKGVEYTFGRVLDHFSLVFHRNLVAIKDEPQRRSLRSVTRTQEREWETDWNPNRGMIIMRANHQVNQP